jgi:hypothetical protein
MIIKIDLILFLVLVLFVFKSFLGLGVRVANDFPLVSQESLKTGLYLPQTWSRTGDNLGEYVVSTLWSWPLDISYAFGASLGLNFSILERIFGALLFLVVGVLSIRRFFQELPLGIFAKFVGSFLYLTSTFALLLIDGGQFQIALAYAFFPLAFHLILEGIRGGSKQRFLSGFAVSLLGFFDIRFVYVLGILLIFKFFYEAFFLEREKVFSYLLSWAKTGFTIIFVFVGLNFYWILPAVLVKAPTLPATYQRVTQTSFLSFASFGHSLFMLQPHWYKNVFGKVTPILPEFVLIPILAFLAPILRRKDKTVGFWLLVALVGVFLVKGSNPPLAGVYPWLFAHIPGFSLFRDPTKFFFLVTLSYSVLIAITTDELVRRFNFSFFIAHHSLNLISLFLISYSLFIIRPVWLGKMTGTFSEPIYKEKFEQVNRIIEEDASFGRVFWIPTKAPLGFSSPTHPSIEASRFYQRRPFASGVVGSYETFNFLREAPFMGEIFDVAGIRYIVYPFPDTRREELKQDNIDYYYAFLDQITALPWIERRLSEVPVPLLKVKNSQDHFFLTKNTFLVVGSDGIYNDLAETNGFRLSENALVFAEEKPELGNVCKENFCRVILYGKEKIDFAATFIDKSRFIFPSQYLDFDPSTNPENAGWWKRETFDFLWMRNFLQQKYGIDSLDFDYGGGYSISEGDNSKFIIHNSKFKSGNVLLARVMKSGRGGRIEFFQGDNKIGEITTKVEKPEKVVIKLTGYKDIPDKFASFDKADFVWSEVGELVGEEPLVVKTSGDINIINAFAIVNKGEWLKIKESIDTQHIIEWNRLSIDEKEDLFSSQTIAKIKYARLSSTHYKVRVEGLDKPTTLAFSENFDSLWRANSLPSVPLYGLINGFYIEKDGEYDIYFSAQRYVLLGVLTSIFFLLFLLAFSVKTRD